MCFRLYWTVGVGENRLGRYRNPFSELERLKVPKRENFYLLDYHRWNVRPKGVYYVRLTN